MKYHGIQLVRCYRQLMRDSLKKDLIQAARFREHISFLLSAVMIFFTFYSFILSRRLLASSVWSSFQQPWQSKHFGEMRSFFYMLNAFPCLWTLRNRFRPYSRATLRSYFANFCDWLQLRHLAHYAKKLRQRSSFLQKQWLNIFQMPMDRQGSCHPEKLLYLQLCTSSI